MDRRDPEYHDVRRARVDEACRLFKAGMMTEDCFRAMLHGYCYRGAEIHAEVVANWPNAIKPTLLTTVTGLR